MKTKKRFALALTLLMVLAVFAGCKSNEETSSQQEPSESFNKTGYPVVDEPITLEMMGLSSPLQPPWEEMAFFKKMKEKTNINFEFSTSTSDQYKQKKQLAFASMELPDVFFAGDFTADEVAKYGSQGMLIPLEDLIEKYAPNFKQRLQQNPGLKASITAPDGHIYALPAIDQLPRTKTPKFWMNGPWLENIGAERPSTVEELYQLFKTFKEQDANQNGKADEIPLSSPDLITLRNYLLPNFGIVQREGIYEEDGKAAFAFIQDGYKAYLEFLHKLYEEKLLDQQIFSHTWEQYTAKGSQNRLGVFPSWPIVVVGFSDPAEAAKYPLLPALTSDVNNEKLVLGNPKFLRGRFAITSENEHPEATMRWVDYLYSKEGSTLARFGVEGENWKWVDEEKTKWKLAKPPEGMSTTQATAQDAPAAGSPVPMVISKAFFDKEDNPTIHTIEDWIKEEYAPHAKNPFPLVYFTEEEQDKLNTIRPDIETYIEQMEAKFVSGETSLDKWDEYVSTLKDLGVGELVDIYQAAYDRWAESK